MRRAASILAALLALGSCASLPKPAPRPEPVAIVDDASRALAHAAELDRIEEERVRAANAERARTDHVRGTLVGWGFVIGSLCMVVAVFVGLFVERFRKECILLGAFGLIVFACAYGMQEYGRTIAIIGIVSLVGALLTALSFAVYAVVQSKFWKRTALETVKVVQDEVKPALPDEARARIFGKEGTAAATMSATAKRGVALAKKVLGKDNNGTPR